MAHPRLGRRRGQGWRAVDSGALAKPGSSQGERTRGQRPVAMGGGGGRSRGAAPAVAPQDGEIADVGGRAQKDLEEVREGGVGPTSNPISTPWGDSIFGWVRCK